MKFGSAPESDMGGSDTERVEGVRREKAAIISHIWQP